MTNINMKIQGCLVCTLWFIFECNFGFFSKHNIMALFSLQTHRVLDSSTFVVCLFYGCSGKNGVHKTIAIIFCRISGWQLIDSALAYLTKVQSNKILRRSQIMNNCNLHCNYIQKEKIFVSEGYSNFRHVYQHIINWWGR